MIPEYRITNTYIYAIFIMKSLNCCVTQAVMPLCSASVSDGITHYLDRVCGASPGRVDLFMLPEACCWDVRIPLAEHLEHGAVKDELLQHAMRTEAHKRGVWIAFGAFRPRRASGPSGGYANAAYLINPAGEMVYVYDKSYLTELELQAGVLPGSGARVFDTVLGRIAPMICFELNYRVFCDHLSAQRPDLVLFHSQYHGGFQKAHLAYMCRSYLLSAISELPSGVLSPTGRVLATTTHDTDTVTCPLNLDCCLVHMDNNHEKLVAMKQRYGAAVDIHDPGLLGSVEVTSLDPSMSVRQMVCTCGIELLDDYLDRLSRVCIQARSDAMRIESPRP